MAKTLKDLEGWEVIVTDEDGNIINDVKRRSRRGATQNITLKRVTDGLTVQKGDSFKVRDEITGTYSVYLIHEIRLNTINNVMEVTAFTYLRWFELKPLLYYQQFDPQLVEQKKPDEYYKKKFVEEIDKNELYITAELAEIWLSDFISQAYIYEHEKWLLLTNKNLDTDFYVRYICEPDAQFFIKVDLETETRILKKMSPKEFEEHFKRLTIVGNKKRLRMRSAKEELASAKKSQIKVKDEESEVEASKRTLSGSNSDESLSSPNSNAPSSTERSSSDFESSSEEESDSDGINEDQHGKSSARLVVNHESTSSLEDDLSHEKIASVRSKTHKFFDDENEPGSNKRIQLSSSARSASPSRTISISSDDSDSLSLVEDPQISELTQKYSILSQRIKEEGTYNDDIKEYLDSKGNADIDLLELEKIFRDTNQTVKTGYLQLFNDDSDAKSAYVENMAPCRQEQFFKLFAILYDTITHGVSKIICLEGDASTGRSHVVHTALKELYTALDNGAIPNFQFITVNKKMLAESGNIYSCIWRQISGKGTENTGPAVKYSLEYFFNSIPKNKKRPVVLYLDCKCSQNEVKDICQWVVSDMSNLSLIVNCTPESKLDAFLKGIVARKNSEMETILFGKYSKEELQKITAIYLRNLAKSGLDLEDDKIYQDMVAMDMLSDQRLQSCKRLMRRIEIKIDEDLYKTISQEICSWADTIKEALDICVKLFETKTLQWLQLHPEINDSTVLGSYSNHNFKNYILPSDLKEEWFRRLSTRVKKLNALERLFLVSLIRLSTNGQNRVAFSTTDILQECAVLLLTCNFYEALKSLFVMEYSITPTDLRIKLEKIIHWDILIWNLLDEGLLVNSSGIVNATAVYKVVNIRGAIRDLLESDPGFAMALHRQQRKDATN